MHAYETKHPSRIRADQISRLLARIEDYPKIPAALRGAHRQEREAARGSEVLSRHHDGGLWPSFTRASPPRCISIARPHHPRRISRRPLHLPREPLGAFTRAGRGLARVDFYMSYAFRSRLFERLVGRLFAKAVEKYTTAFEARADTIYGRSAPALAS